MNLSLIRLTVAWRLIVLPPFVAYCGIHGDCPLLLLGLISGIDLILPLIMAKMLQGESLLLEGKLFFHIVLPPSDAQLRDGYAWAAAVLGIVISLVTAIDSIVGSGLIAPPDSSSFLTFAVGVCML